MEDQIKYREATVAEKFAHKIKFVLIAPDGKEFPVWRSVQGAWYLQGTGTRKRFRAAGHSEAVTIATQKLRNHLKL